MFQHATRRAISLPLFLTASIIFQTVPVIRTSVVLAQKRKPVQGAPPQPPVEGKPLPDAPAVPVITASKVEAWDDSLTPDDDPLWLQPASSASCFRNARCISH